MDKTYLEISIFNKQNPNIAICIGRILLDNTDGWFEGVEQGQEKFLFGIFLRPKEILLYSMDTKSNIDYLKLSRGYDVRYEGNTSENLRVQMIIKSLETDPRDMDTEKEEFKARLEEFKETFLIGKNIEKYMQYYDQRGNISKYMMEKDENKNNFLR